MKKHDLLFSALFIAIVLPFMPVPFFADFQKSFLYNESFWLITSFIKFALLATLGESIGLRINAGVYNRKGFGLIPRAIVWGFLGIGIKIAFVVYASGVPGLVEKYFGVADAVKSMDKTLCPDFFSAIDNGLGFARFLTAFCISAIMNLTFAPVFMTYHKITDTHIIDNGGTIGGFLRWIKIKEIFPRINWFVQWDFVFKRTIPFFWIPMHTITFLMPGEYRIVFAAILGIALGVILAIASHKGNKK